MQVTVVALIKAKAGQEPAVKEALLTLVPLTLQEPGCINYDLHQSSEDPTLFMFHENWRSGADLDRHLAMPYISQVIGRIADWLAEPVTIRRFTRIG